MFANTSSQQQCFPISSIVRGYYAENGILFYQVTLSANILVALLSPVAVVGNSLVLAAIWKKNFVRTPFHVLLSGLAITDLFTGLIAQPFVAAANFIVIKPPRLVCERPTLLFAIGGVANGSATYFFSTTILFITIMSVERWLHMSRRSLVTSHRGYVTVTTVLLLPVPLVVLRCFIEGYEEKYEREVYLMILTMTIVCFIITVYAYFNVYRIIRQHQQQVKANAMQSQNFGQPGINLAKYKRSVVSMLYILLLFSICFFPSVACVVVNRFVGKRPEMAVAFSVSLCFVFLSSTLGPGLYVWRMNDIRNGVKQLFWSA